MKPEIKRKWVKALLSGKYEQGEGQLLDDGRYCCLGVLVAECGGTTSLSEALLDVQDNMRFGLDGEDEQALAHLNDEGVPFEMIAGLIDEAL